MKQIQVDVVASLEARINHLITSTTHAMIENVKLSFPLVFGSAVSSP